MTRIGTQGKCVQGTGGAGTQSADSLTRGQSSEISIRQTTESAGAKMVDREALLGKHYKIDRGEDRLPGSILSSSKRIVEANVGGGIPTPADGKRAGAGSVDAVDAAEKQMLGQVFQDERINLRQRESIAKAILAGEYTLGEPRDARGVQGGFQGHPLAAVRDLDISRGEGLLRRHGMKKPRFLQVVSAPAPVLVATASAVLQHEQQKRRSKAKKTAYFLFNQYLPEEERPIYPDRGTPALHSEFFDQRASMLQQSKLDLVKRCKEEAALCKELAAREKRRDQDAKEKKHQVRNQIRDFRLLVLQRLTERADPLQGKIMRALTDKTALDIMEHYRGFTMTVDAIITLLGTSLGRDVACTRANNNNNNSPNNNNTNNNNHHNNNNNTYTGASESMERAMEKGAPFSNEYPLGGRSFGSRAASRPRPITPPPAMATPTGPDEVPISSSGKPRAPPRSWSPSWNAPSPTVRRLGSGFTMHLARTGSRSGSRGRQADAVDGITTSLLLEQPGELCMTDSFASKVNVETTEDAVAQRAIASLIDEMKGDGTLPSLQPERVLTDMQLERLGTNEATFDLIAREVRYQRSKKMKQKEERENKATLDMHDVESGFHLRLESGFATATDLDRRTHLDEIERITNPGELHFPCALKTTPSYEPTTPYKSYSEKQLVMAQGIAAGSGLALWTGPRQKPWTPSIRPKSSPGDPGSRSRNVSEVKAKAKLQMLS